MHAGRRILLGVTSDVSLTLMRGFPQYLAERGWQVHVVSSPGPLLEELRGVEGVSVHELAMVRDPSVVSDVRALVAWRRLLRDVRPDVVSVGTPKAGLLGGLAAAWLRVPSRFYQLRGLRLETSRGPKRWILTAAERAALASAHRVLSVSPSLKDRVVELGLVRTEKVSVPAKGSSNGVDIERFAGGRFSETEIEDLRTGLGIDPAVLTLGFVGRLTKDKGLEALIDAMRILEQKDVRLQLLVVGAVDDQSGDELLGRMRGGRIAVIETGHVADTAIYYRLMDVLCLPTLREGFPNVVLEAGASGVPTITTDATGAIDSVVDGQTGLIVDAGSGERLADGIATLAGDPALIAAMGVNAQRYVAENYRRRDVWAALDRAYSEPASPRVTRAA